MIQDHDRSGWFGASDVAVIMGSWKTATFRDWWMTKLGLHSGGYCSRAMYAGTYYEHPILDAIGAERKDHQILIPELRLRVNLDGDGPGRIWEVKTHSDAKPFKPSRAQLRQVSVQMYAKKFEEGKIPRAEIVAYGLLDEDYRNFFNPVEKRRITRHPVEYDKEFIGQFLERIAYLRDCLEKGVWPK